MMIKRRQQLRYWDTASKFTSSEMKLILTLVLLSCYACNGFKLVPSGPAFRALGKMSLTKSGSIGEASFHHIEFVCGDATTTSRHMMLCTGAQLAAKSDLSTGNTAQSSYLVQTGDVKILVSAPSVGAPTPSDISTQPFPQYSPLKASNFLSKHGLSVSSVAITVDNVPNAYEFMRTNGGKPVCSPTIVYDRDATLGYCEMAEVNLYGDVSLRLVDTKNFKGAFLPNFEDVKPPGAKLNKLGKYGIDRIDHVVGNVHSLQDTLAYMKSMTGFHDFAEFTAEDVGTVDSGLNSAVLASDNEMVLLPINEPTFGTKRKSQIQTYLEQNQGEGVQHIALFTPDIITTLGHMQAATASGGFEFMPAQAHDYYERVKAKLGAENPFSEEQFAKIEKLGILIDKDDQGILMQIFTKPIGDRPTFFFEIIQRVGCEDAVTGLTKPGCGGFGKGNFKDLFKSIEDYETELKINV